MSSAVLLCTPASAARKVRTILYCQLVLSRLRQPCLHSCVCVAQGAWLSCLLHAAIPSAEKPSRHRAISHQMLCGLLRAALLSSVSPFFSKSNAALLCALASVAHSVSAGCVVFVLHCTAATARRCRSCRRALHGAQHELFLRVPLHLCCADCALHCEDVGQKRAYSGSLCKVQMEFQPC